MKEFLKLLLIVTAVFSTLSAQTQPSPEQADETWEYLIVSTANFGDKANLAVPEKWLGRRQGNVGFYQETQIQNEFDRLGKLGWELVGILPMNSGEQSSIERAKFIFKRRANALRSQNEAEELKKLVDSLNSQKPKEPNFVDLDAAAAQSEQKESENKANQKIEQLIRTIKGYSIVSVKTRSWFPGKNDRRVVAEVVIDASRELLKEGNKFRSSEVKRITRQAALDIFNAAQLKPVYPNQEPWQETNDVNFKGVSIKLSVVVTNNGVTKTLSEGMIQGLWSEEQYP